MSDLLGYRIMRTGEEKKKLERQLEEKGAAVWDGDAGMGVLITPESRDLARSLEGVIVFEFEENDPIGRDILGEANR